MKSTAKTLPSDILNKTYHIIVVDPPWKYSKTIGQGVAQEQYQTLTDKELSQWPIEQVAAKDCMLLMWATGPKLDAAVHLMEQWGFRYVTIFFNWIKVTKEGKPVTGLGHYTRSSSELCLLGVRGKPLQWKESCSVPQVLLTTKAKHSEKPAEEVQGRLKTFVGARRYATLKKLELFARQRHDKSWTYHGNELH